MSKIGKRIIADLRKLNKRLRDDPDFLDEVRLKTNKRILAKARVKRGEYIANEH